MPGHQRFIISAPREQDCPSTYLTLCTQLLATWSCAALLTLQEEQKQGLWQRDKQLAGTAGRCGQQHLEEPCVQAKGAMPHHGTSRRGKRGGLAGIQGCPCQD